MTTKVESLSENMLPVNQKDYQKLEIYISLTSVKDHNSCNMLQTWMIPLYVYHQWSCNICAVSSLIENYSNAVGGFETRAKMCKNA